MEAVKKYWFWGILISILSIFAMSHNVDALEFQLNFDDYRLSNKISRPNLDLYFNNDRTTCVNVANCAPVVDSDFTRIKKLKTHNTYQLKTGDIVVLRVFIGAQNPVSGSFTSGSPFIDYNYTTNVNQFYYIGHNVQDVSTDLNILSQLGYGPNQDEYYTQITTIYRTLKIYDYYFKSSADQTISLGLESTYYDSNAASIFTYPSYSSPGSLYFRIIGFDIYSPTESKENKEVEEKTQGAVDESQTAGGDSSTSAQTGTTGLLNAITGAVSVISSAQPTNCKINGNMGNLDIGQLDLCANPAPAFVQTIGSLILILMCVPLAISLFNRFIAIFRSFQS